MTSTQTAPRGDVRTIDNSALLDSIVEKQQEMAARYRPVMDIKESIDRYEQLRRYVAEAMFEGEDYGSVEGVAKPFLFQAGAEKLNVLFGYVPHYEMEREIEDWEGTKYGEPLFYYRIRCIMQRDGNPVGEGIGSASSWESKYRYRWVAKDDVPPKLRGAIERGELKTRDGSISELKFAIEKAETSGKYGKPPEYWSKWRAAVETGEAIPVKRKSKAGKEMDAYEMGATVYRVPNPDIADVVNTCQKMAVKRAKVAAAIAATGLSSLFTQDEDSAGLPDLSQDSRSAGEAKNKPRTDSAPVDEELQAMFASLKASNGKNAAAILRDLENRLILKHADAGATAFNTVSKAFRARVPKGQQTVDDVKALITELLMALRALEQGPEPMSPDMEDIPHDWADGRE